MTKRKLLPIAFVCLAFTFGCKANQTPNASPSPTQSAATTTPPPTSKTASTLVNLKDGRTQNFDLTTSNWNSDNSFGQIYFINPNNHFMLNAVKDATFLDAGTTSPSEAPETGYSAPSGGMEVFADHVYLVKIPGDPTTYSRIKVTYAEGQTIGFDFTTRLDGKRGF